MCVFSLSIFVLCVYAMILITFSVIDNFFLYLGGMPVYVCVCVAKFGFLVCVCVCVCVLACVFVSSSVLFISIIKSIVIIIITFIHLLSRPSQS